MKKYLLILAMAIAAIALFSNSVKAESSIDEELYRNDKICFVNSSYDYSDPKVPVTDFEIRDGFMWGTTSWTVLSCAPLSCPEGTFMVSSNICSFTDPFAHIPVIDDSGDEPTAELLATVATKAKRIVFAEDSPFWAGRSV